jgi:hypothetical protein
MEIATNTLRFRCPNSGREVDSGIGAHWDARLISIRVRCPICKDLHEWLVADESLGTVSPGRPSLKGYSIGQSAKCTSGFSHGNSGNIIVCGDYEGDLNAIVDNLNPLQWSCGYSGRMHEWTVEQDCINKSEREIIVPNGDVPDPSVRPIGHIFVLRDRRCFADESNNGKHTKASLVFSITTNIRSASLVLLFHRTSTRARLNLYQCADQV